MLASHVSDRRNRSTDVLRNLLLAQATESPARSVRTSAQVPSVPSSPPFWAIARPLFSVLGETQTVAADSGACEENVIVVLKTKKEDRSCDSQVDFERSVRYLIRTSTFSIAFAIVWL